MYYVLVYESSSTYELENWLNQRHADGYELVSFSDNTFVFKHEQHEYGVLFGARSARQTKPVFVDN